MSVPTGTYQAFSAIGIREDLSDVIKNISPVAFPFMSNISSGRATQTYHEWQTDSLAAAAVNSQIEGDDANTNTASPTTRLANYCMISTKVPRVSGTLRASDTAGRADEMSYQEAKLMKELKRDMETALCGTQAAVAGGVGTARVCAGIAAYLWTNQVQIGASATTPTVTSGAPTTAPTAGTAATTVTEANLKSALSSAWDAGGEPTVVLVGSYNKQQISSFDGIATLYRDTQGMRPGVIVGAADAYVHDFGQVQIVASRFTTAGDVYVLDMEQWSLDYLRPVKITPLAKTGDSDRSMILAEYTLKAAAPDANAKIYTTVSS